MTHIGNQGNVQGLLCGYLLLILLPMATLNLGCSRRQGGQVDKSHDIPEYASSNRFLSFTTGPDLILVTIAGISNTAERTIIIENPCWKALLDQEQGITRSHSDYVRYMLTNHASVFHLNDEIYNELVLSNDAELLPEHQRLIGKGRNQLVARYMHVIDSQYKSNFYFTDFVYDLKLNEKEQRSLGRLFIEEGLPLSRDCVSGTWQSGL